MKLPIRVSDILHRTKEEKETFVSLLLAVDSVQAAAWQMGHKNTPEIIGTVACDVSHDTWEERTQAVDTAIAQLEEKAATTALHKVVLGLPVQFLTQTGDIQKPIRAEIKKLTDALDLKPIGFVPTPQAIVYQLKRIDGVPSSVILIGVDGNTLTVSLYKIGTLVGQTTIERDTNVADGVERSLKSFTNAEILPSRMLLYGGRMALLDEVKRELLRHPWQTRANFLHFPKIEVLSGESVIAAVSLAGASELAVAMGEELEEEVKEREPETGGSDKAEETALDTAKKSMITETREEEAPETIGEEEESNVVMVQPEALGFQKNVDVLEKAPLPQVKKGPPIPKPHEEEKRDEEEAEVPQEPERVKLHRPGIPKFPSLPVALPSFSALRSFLAAFSGGKTLSVAIAFFAIVGVAAGALWLVPRATVTIVAIPKTLTASATITVDPQAPGIDSEASVIPGSKQEKTVSGEKTTAVTGKKNVGDPAKGTVTIYNKSTTGRLLKKNTVMTSGALQFTLDDDMPVASASESIGSITFGKVNAPITASSIGPQANLPAGTEFTFKDLAPSIAVARNDQPLTGGTSKEVTVVSRSDYDALVKELATELTKQAEQELVTAVEGSKKLIAETVKTTVSEKTFTQELDEEATQLQGKLTVVVSGISYSEEDITSLLTGALESTIPQGYTQAPGRSSVSVGKLQMKKDGTITLDAQLSTAVVPSFDLDSIRRSLAGKKLTSAQDTLRATEGVAGAAFDFHFSPWNDRLPMNKNNISIRVEVQE